MEFHIIAAIAEKNVIGNKGKLPWFYSEDLAHFRKLTLENTVLMGRKTYESIIDRIKKPLSNRKNIVVTRDSSFKPPRGVLVAYDIEEAVKKARALDKTAFIIGGAQIYKEMYRYAEMMHITEIKKKYNGDTVFPDYNKSEWEEISREIHPEFDFADYKRTYWSA